MWRPQQGYVGFNGDTGGSAIGKELAWAIFKIIPESHEDVDAPKQLYDPQMDRCKHSSTDDFGLPTVKAIAAKYVKHRWLTMSTLAL